MMPQQQQEKEKEKEKQLCHNLILNGRILIGGRQPGILRYVGNFHLAPGIFAGVELDQPLGKHDGSVDGRRYFSCPMDHGVLAPVEKISMIDENISLNKMEIDETILTSDERGITDMEGILESDLLPTFELEVESSDDPSPRDAQVPEDPKTPEAQVQQKAAISQNTPKKSKPSKPAVVVNAPKTAPKKPAAQSKISTRWDPDEVKAKSPAPKKSKNDEIMEKLKRSMEEEKAKSAIKKPETVSKIRQQLQQPATASTSKRIRTPSATSSVDSTKVNDPPQTVPSKAFTPAATLKPSRSRQASGTERTPAANAKVDAESCAHSKLPPKTTPAIKTASRLQIKKHTPTIAAPGAKKQQPVATNETGTQAKDDTLENAERGIVALACLVRHLNENVGGWKLRDELLATRRRLVTLELQLKREISERNSHQNAAEELEKRIKELKSRHNRETNRMKEELAVALSEVDAHRAQCVDREKQIDDLKRKMQDDLTLHDEKIRCMQSELDAHKAAIRAGGGLQAEIDSLRTVLELRTAELHQLRADNLRLKSEVDRLKHVQDKNAGLSAKVEDLTAIMKINRKTQRQLEVETCQSKAQLSRSDIERRRLRLQNEQLMFRLRQLGQQPHELPPDPALLESTRTAPDEVSNRPGLKRCRSADFLASSVLDSGIYSSTFSDANERDWSDFDSA